jgi:ribosomal protein S18 acetylase RimI-like enzyme
LTAPAPALELRPAEEDDWAFLERVYASTRTEELASVPWSPEQKAAFLTQQFGAQRAHYERHYADADTHVILVDGEPAGRLMVWRSRDEILIVDIALLPAHRSRGIGSRLLAPLIQEANAGQIPLSIHVEHTNPALRLYQRLGFEQVGDDGVYLTMRRSPSAKYS